MRKVLITTSVEIMAPDGRVYRHFFGEITICDEHKTVIGNKIEISRYFIASEVNVNYEFDHHEPVYYA